MTTDFDSAVKAARDWGATAVADGKDTQVHIDHAREAGAASVLRNGLSPIDDHDWGFLPATERNQKKEGSPMNGGSFIYIGFLFGVCLIGDEHWHLTIPCYRQADLTPPPDPLP